MREEKLLLLSRLADCSHHPLAKYIEGDLFLNAPVDAFYLQPLRQLFTRVIQYDFLARVMEIGIQGVNAEIVSLVKREKPKYVLWLSTMYEILPATMDVIRQEGCTLIAWFGDDEYRFAFYCQWWLPHIDYCVTHDPESVPRYRALGARPIFAFPCEGIPLQKDWSKVEETYDVSFVGRKTKPKRGEYIDELLRNGISLSLFGRGWDNGYVTTEQMIDIFSTSKINLNFTGTGNRKGLKGRIAIVCLAGGFLLTEYTPGLENYFKIGKEIACFKNTEEMIEKIEYYLAHDEERKAIARAGWTRAMHEYTPFHMMSRIFSAVDEDLASRGNQPAPRVGQMPFLVRNAHSQFYLQWGRAFSEVGDKVLACEALELSLSYNRWNGAAWFYRSVGRLPGAPRRSLFKLYGLAHAISNLLSRIRALLYTWADAVPGLKHVKRNVSRRLSYS